MVDLRCKYCNWLNKEVQENFVCRNCSKETFVKTEVEKTEEDIQIISKRKVK